MPDIVHSLSNTIRARSNSRATVFDFCPVFYVDPSIVVIVGIFLSSRVSNSAAGSVLRLFSNTCICRDPVQYVALRSTFILAQALPGGN